MLENRQQCRADTVRVYSAPDGNGYWTGAVIHNGIYVNVDNHYNGVWWHINAPYGGWVLAEYFY
ncbi:hypothetical protein [Actinokineospora cianjurensis]|uniref:SH3 domain-containing protein n=1 Tax=Actinokineospora cianjurensis TaxID=585224 RepID=A0A421BCC6_9PSEU|nr:hypothetical protein [Actinokineospora cianjurensis]RLK61997.1 hypothetical protein CLV68_2548 [Actinokineospora cianjurensis]